MHVCLVFSHLQVFVEFQNAVQQCSWVQVYGEGVKALLVEESIVWAPQSDGTGSAAASANSSVWPALVSMHLEGCRREFIFRKGTLVVCAERPVWMVIAPV